MGVLDDMLAVLAREAEPQEGCRGLGVKIHFPMSDEHQCTWSSL